MPSKKLVHVQLSKNNGAPQAVMLVSPKASLASMQGALAGLYKDKVALKSVGLKFCEGCKSGLDIWIKNEFDGQIDVPALG
ncbi:MAG TPA: hypothetical protein VK824_03530 [Planctomycetota bacterium]|nr:hypothetical protein [Planctomycetota bacterium]